MSHIRNRISKFSIPTISFILSLVIGFFLLLAVPAITTSLGSASTFGTATESTIVCPALPTRTLAEGQSGSAVKSLQEILNMSPATRIALIGPGSPGHETTLFGALTKAAVVRFQNEYATEILTPNHLSKGTGFVGPSTLTEIAAQCSAPSSESTSESLSTPAVSPSEISNSGQTVAAPSTIAPADTQTISSESGSQTSTQTSNTSSTGTSGSSATTGSKNRKNSGSGSTNTSSGSNGSGTTGSSSTGTSASSGTGVNLAASSGLQWGAYVGDGSGALAAFESEVGAQPNLVATFEGWSDSFPSNLSSTVGQQGKTLVIFWEPNFGYSTIVSGSEDSYIQQFAADAKSYGYPVILVPFDEMNLNEEDWGYGNNGNTAALFQQAWDHVHGFFSADSNVKFAIDYNNVSVPNVSGNQFSDYYPGSSYVDYVGIDGFNFGNPWQTFDQVFDSAVSSLQSFGKPIYLLSVGSAEGPQKAAWITEGLGAHIETYSDVVGWIWFNQDDSTVPSSGDTVDWKIDSDPAALAAFQAIIP